jgi:hydrogenase nickel incorporation protein HypA/HybF
MHELAVTESMLKIALQHAENAGASSVTDLHVVMGDLSSIVDDSIQFYWDIISESTNAAKARLHFRRIPAEFVCRDCGHQYQPQEDSFGCPVCNSIRVKLVAGDEFYIESIDVNP